MIRSMKPWWPIGSFISEKSAEPGFGGRVEDAAVRVDLQHVELAVLAQAEVRARVAADAELDEDARGVVAQALLERGVVNHDHVHLVVVDPLHVVVLERLALGEDELHRLEGERVGRIVRVLGDQAGELAALDELLDQGAALGLHGDGGLGLQVLHVGDARLLAEADAGKAMRRLDQHGEAQRAAGALHVRHRLDERGGRRGNADAGRHALHFLACRVEAMRVGAREGRAQFLERLDQLHAPRRAHPACHRTG